MGATGEWAEAAIGAEFLFRVIVGVATLSTIGCSSGSSSQPSVSADGAVAAGGSGQDASSGNSASGSSGGTTSPNSAGSEDAASQGADAAESDSGGLGAAGSDGSNGWDSEGAQETGAGTSGSGNDGGGSATTDGGSDATAPGDDGGGGDSGGWVDLFNGVDFTGFNANCNMAHTTSPPTITGAAAMAYFAAENGTIHVYPTQADQSTQPFCLFNDPKVVYPLQFIVGVPMGLQEIRIHGRPDGRDELRDVSARCGRLVVALWRRVANMAILHRVSEQVGLNRRYLCSLRTMQVSRSARRLDDLRAGVGRWNADDGQRFHWVRSASS